MSLVKWTKPTMPQGVVISADKEQEWYAVWFLSWYQTSNQYPVVLFDCGMSDQMVTWCSARKGVTVVPAPQGMGWFIKPHALLNSPFERTVWLDVDCRVRANIAKLFHPEEGDTEYLMLRRDDPYTNTEWMKKLYPGETMYNSGVIGINHGHPVVPQWYAACHVGRYWCRGDQEMLSRLLYLYSRNKDWKITELPLTYNNLRLEKQDSSAVIQHLTGPAGKAEIMAEVRKWKEEGKLK